MTWRFGVASDIGGREEQQDRVDIIAATDGDNTLLVLADGMGGHHGGALAAQAVIDAAKNYINHTDMSEPLASLEELCIRAHQAIIELDREGNQSPGSTCVMLHLSANEASWAHVGDSRLYHFRNGALLTRTLDHSMVQLLVTQGELSEAEMAGSPLQNQLYMRLGGEQLPKPDLGAADVQHGDVFLLCSDGFWEYVEHHEVSATLADTAPEEAAARLVALARERGGSEGDNISVAMAQWQEARKKFPWFS